MVRISHKIWWTFFIRGITHSYRPGNPRETSLYRRAMSEVYFFYKSGWKILFFLGENWFWKKSSQKKFGRKIFRLKNSHRQNLTTIFWKIFGAKSWNFRFQNRNFRFWESENVWIFQIFLVKKSFFVYFSIFSKNITNKMSMTYFHPKKNWIFNIP